jgi:hypothetical protein
MRIKFGLLDFLLFVAVFALFYFRNWQAFAFLVVVVAYAAFRYHKSKKSEPPADSNEFLIEDKDETFTAELDTGLDYRTMPNHFHTDYHFDTCRTKCLYEYRLEGTDVLCCLIEHQYEDIGVPMYRDVCDGVVSESDIRKRDAQSRFHITKVEDRIAELNTDIQWHKMDSMSWHGLKYFILSKKLPQPDARRYLRQELERLKTGETAFFKEAERYGLERNEDSLDRLKLVEGKMKPSDEEFRKLSASAETFGITSLEFSRGKKLTGVLNKLLGD